MHLFFLGAAATDRYSFLKTFANLVCVCVSRRLISFSVFLCIEQFFFRRLWTKGMMMGDFEDESRLLFEKMNRLAGSIAALVEPFWNGLSALPLIALHAFFIALLWISICVHYFRIRLSISLKVNSSKLHPQTRRLFSVTIINQSIHRSITNVWLLY